MRRRAFIALLGGAAAWPLVARAQQFDRVRRIGILINFAADDPAARSRLEAFLDGLHSLGWIDGRNVQIDLRWVLETLIGFGSMRPSLCRSGQT